MSISSEALAAIRAHAAEDESVEACGLLLGMEGHIVSTTPATNVADAPQRHFEIDPAVLVPALRAERAGGPRLLGYYHSHPHGPANPSDTDRSCAARDGKLWLIVAGDEVLMWAAEPGGFRAVQMIES